MTIYLRDCGVVCALGRGKTEVAPALLAGRIPAPVERDGRLVGMVRGALPSPPAVVQAYDSRNNRLMLVAMAEIGAAIENVAQRYGRHRIAVVLGTSTSGIAEGEAALAHYRENGRWPPAFHYRQQETGSLAAFAAGAFDLTGPAYTVATACSSSAKVFAAGRRLLRSGTADAVIVGGADTLCDMTLGGFGALEALSKGRCNPFSKNRDGIHIGEGAAAFLMVQEAEGEDGQGGPVVLLGIGESSDAHHATAPDPEGHGARESMARALRDASLAPEAIGYINLHGTATPLNDAMEGKAVAGLFGSRTPCSSTKALTGHMLGGTGGVEAAFLWLTLTSPHNPGLLPPHLWDGVADPALPSLNLVASGTPLPVGAPRAMLSNSFGFGGSNVSLILGQLR